MFFKKKLSKIILASTFTLSAGCVLFSNESSNVYAATISSYQAKTTANLNVRTGPSTNTKILSVLPKGTVVTVTPYNKNWVKINFKGSTAFVSSHYVQKVTTLGSKKASGASSGSNVQHKEYDAVVSYNGKTLTGSLFTDAYSLFFTEKGKREPTFIFSYNDNTTTFTRVQGEASFKLKVKKGNKEFIFSGLNSDFFNELYMVTPVIGMK